MDSSGAEKTLPLAFPLPLCPGGVKAGGLPQYLPLGWVDKGGGFPANLRLMANKCRGSQETSSLCGCCKNQHSNSWLHDGQKLWLEKKMGFEFLTAWLSETSAWELCGCCHFRTSNSWLRDCQKLNFWKKIECPLPDCMIAGNLNLNENWTPNSWLHACPELGSSMELK